MVFGWTFRFLSTSPSLVFSDNQRFFYLHNTDDKNAEAANLAESQFVSNLIKAKFAGEQSGIFSSGVFASTEFSSSEGETLALFVVW